MLIGDLLEGIALACLSVARRCFLAHGAANDARADCRVRVGHVAVGALDGGLGGDDNSAQNMALALEEL